MNSCSLLLTTTCLVKYIHTLRSLIDLDASLSEMDWVSYIWFLTEVKMFVMISWDLTSCSLVGGYQRFGWKYFLHLQGFWRHNPGDQNWLLNILLLSELDCCKLTTRRAVTWFSSNLQQWSVKNGIFYFTQLKTFACLFAYLFQVVPTWDNNVIDAIKNGICVNNN